MEKRVTVGREAFSKLCVEAGGAVGGLSGAAVGLRTLGHTKTADTIHEVGEALRRALAEAVASARPDEVA